MSRRSMRSCRSMGSFNGSLKAIRGLGRVRSGLAWIAAFGGTIRGRILIAFLILSMITAALGGFAVVSIKRAGTLVEKTFDESLMSINYARAAAADFANMREAFARRWTTSDPEARSRLDHEIEALRLSLSEDLSIAAERSQSKRASEAAARVRHAVEDWDAVRQRLLLGAEPD